MCGKLKVGAWISFVHESKMGELRQGSGSLEETVCEHADGGGGYLAENATQNSHCV